MSERKATVHEPLFHLSKRASLPQWKSWLIRILAVALGLVVCGIVAYLLSDRLREGKKTLADFYYCFYKGSFSTERKMWKFLKNTAVLQCISLAVTPAFRMRFWNIGAEGQTLMGIWGAIAVAFYFGGTVPEWVLLIMMLAAALICGMIWAVIPALFKAKWNTNETLFTLMLNYIAIQITSYFVSLWENPKGSNVVGIINQRTNAGWLPNLLSDGYNNDFGWNVIIVLALAVGMYIYLKYSKQGYEIAVVGESENTARYAGIKLSRVYIRTMAISGAVCGIAGFIAVSGAGHTISTSTAGGRGFTAIIVAWLAKFNTFVMILIAFLLVFLEKGAVQIASQFQLNDFVSEMLTGIILFFILGSEFFINYKLVFRGRKEAQTK